MSTVHIPPRKLPILVVLHQEHSTCGRLGHALTAKGHALDIRRPRYGDPLPQTMAQHAGAVVCGGPMSANDPDEYIRREIDWLSVPLKENKPLLGICLGAQMLVRQLGGRVTADAAGRAEIGYYPIRPTEHGNQLCGPWPDHVYHWHSEGFDAPSGSTVLAEGDIFPVQAFKFGSGYGVQFHPEVTHAMMCRWTTRGHARLSLPGARPRTSHFTDRAVHDFAIRTWLSAFLGCWISQPARSVAAHPRCQQAAPRVSGARSAGPAHDLDLR